MTERVDKFIEEFDSAIDAHRRFSDGASSVSSARRKAQQLADELDRLAVVHGTTRSVSSSELRSLDEELRELRPPPLDPLVTNAKALLQLVEDQILDGDAGRLQALLAESKSLTMTRKRGRSSGQTHLDTPAKAVCQDCDDLLVGRRQAALNWNAITKVIRDHEREVHGGYTDETRDSLSEGLKSLRAGETVVAAGRYRIGDV